MGLATHMHVARNYFEYTTFHSEICYKFDKYNIQIKILYFRGKVVRQGWRTDAQRRKFIDTETKYQQKYFITSANKGMLPNVAKHGETRTLWNDFVIYSIFVNELYH